MFYENHPRWRSEVKGQILLFKTSLKFFPTLKSSSRNSHVKVETEQFLKTYFNRTRTLLASLDDLRYKRKKILEKKENASLWKEGKKSFHLTERIGIIQTRKMKLGAKMEREREREREE